MLTQRQHWISWFLLATFFFAHYFVRLAPTLMGIELMRQYSISIGHIGTISSLYFLTYTFSQIPVGYLMKHYSSRTLIGTASLACGLMAVCFSLSPTYIAALLSLMLYAFFGAFGFVGAVSYASQNIPAYSSLLVGLTQSMGMGAGFIATNLVISQLSIRPWQEIVQFEAMGLAILGIIIFTFVPGFMYQAPKASTDSATNAIEDANKPKKSIYCNLQTWTNALYAGFIYFPLMVFTEGGTGLGLLGSIHNQPREDIAFATSMIFIAWMIGGPISGLIADRYGRTKIMRLSALAGFITTGLALFVPLSSMGLIICLFVFGITNTGIVGCYSIAADMHGSENASVSIAIANMSTILVGSILCGILPQVLELTSTAHMVDGIPYYSAIDYQRVFGSAMIFAPAFAFVCAYLTKETSAPKIES